MKRHSSNITLEKLNSGLSLRHSEDTENHLASQLFIYPILEAEDAQKQAAVHLTYKLCNQICWMRQLLTNINSLISVNIAKIDTTLRDLFANQVYFYKWIKQQREQAHRK